MSRHDKTAMPHRQIWKLIALVMLVQVFGQFVRNVVVIELRDGGMAMNTVKNLTYFIVIPFLLVMLYPVWKEHKGVITNQLRLSQLTFKVVASGVMLGIALRMSVHGELIFEAGVGLVRNTRPDAIVGPEIYWSCPPMALMVLHLVSMGIVAPLAEEIVNRGWFLHWLERYGRFIAISVSTLLFMVMHEPGTRAMIMPFVFGIFVAIHVLNSGTLWAALIAHGIANSLVILDWLCLRYNWNPLETTTATAATAVIALFAAFFALAFSGLLVSRRIAEPASGPSDPPSTR